MFKLKKGYQPGVYVPLMALFLVQKELVVSYWQKNGHLILVNCLREACPRTLLLSN